MTPDTRTGVAAQKFLRASGAIGLAAAACVTYGVAVERRWYRLRHLRLDGVLRRGPGGRAPLPLRVLHLSDLHVQPREPKLGGFLREVAGHDYDLVVLTGDLLGNTDVEDHALELLDPILAKAPGLMVLGSNDVFGPTQKSPSHYLLDPDHRVHGDRLDTDRLIDGLRERGVTTLRGGTTKLATRSGDVLASGLDDPHLATSKLPELDAIGVPADTDAVLHLGLTHAPYTAALDMLIEAGHDLLLAGHTHGGQVRFPPYGAVVGNCDLPLDQIRGASKYEGRWLHVSPGLGSSPYTPFRFACRPEATLLHLTL
ncbi:MAG: putative MPP superfamily phosphohydrolase [Glaciecola sp.]|jgi:predicted MPP superfamily phosphohydrolase